MLLTHGNTAFFFVCSGFHPKRCHGRPRRWRLGLAISHHSDLQGDKVPTAFRREIVEALLERQCGLMKLVLICDMVHPHLDERSLVAPCRLLQVVRSIRLVRFLSALRALVLSVVDAWRDGAGIPDSPNFSVYMSQMELYTSHRVVPTVNHILTTWWHVDMVTLISLIHHKPWHVWTFFWHVMCHTVRHFTLICIYIYILYIWYYIHMIYFTHIVLFTHYMNIHTIYT